jgi:hypothetical protein
MVESISPTSPVTSDTATRRRQRTMSGALDSVLQRRLGSLLPCSIQRPQGERRGLARRSGCAPNFGPDNERPHGGPRLVKVAQRNEFGEQLRSEWDQNPPTEGLPILRRNDRSAWCTSGGTAEWIAVQPAMGDTRSALIANGGLHAAGHSELAWCPVAYQTNRGSNSPSYSPR